MAGGAHGTTRALKTVTWLRERISSGAWPLDSKIPTEQELVDLLGVGRSTVREAVRTLANQGMLETAPGRGTFVRARTPVNSLLTDYLVTQRLPELLQLRRALEVEAAGLAAARRSEDDVRHLDLLLAEQGERRGGESTRTPVAPGDFHADLFTMSGNGLMTDVFQGVIAALRGQIARGNLVLADRALRHQDHLDLVERIRAQDVDGARAVAALHCSRDIMLA